MSDFWPLLAGLVGVLAGLFSWRRLDKFKKEVKKDDEENAAAIRDRVADDRADRVRKLDDAGWRD